MGLYFQKGRYTYMVHSETGKAMANNVIPLFVTDKTFVVTSWNTIKKEVKKKFLTHLQ